MPDIGASSHFATCLSAMKEVEEGVDLGVEVHCSMYGKMDC